MRTGIWLVGGRGSVATTTITGAAAMRAGLAPAYGCVTELPAFSSIGLPGFDELVFGGHDVVQTDLVKRAEELAAAGVFPRNLPEAVREDLMAADAEILPCADGDASSTQAMVAEALVADINDFRRRNNLERVVVVNVSSTEAPIRKVPAHDSLAALREALAQGQSVLPSSSLFAYAAFLADCPFVDFTPSPGARIPALDELARERGLPYAGSDGKTGETLVKSTLAPMFAHRALRVKSWHGTNVLGGGDGANLADPERVISKSISKAMVLEAILKYQVEGGVHIHNLVDMGDWKTAWDHVTFEGFLGTRMTMQFIWQGCDSSLAAPLVLDLARLVAVAHREGVSGPMPELAFFFKDPVGTDEHELERQYIMLTDWAEGLQAKG
ncbi:inositol-3-phosphate synthase [Nonomuraea typhae]|uniref:Inositol-3-phosphate synthase n=1 Tax=Nonomuraea typhae TaxID=2603600 RepID=A0ABW7Z9C0_9ACTN